MELPTTQNRADSPLFLGRTPVLYALAAHAGGRRWHRQNVIRVCYEDIFVLCSLAMKGRQLIRRLKAAGVEIIEGRGKGGHVIARYRGRQTTVPVHGSRDIGPDFIRKLCRQLGLDPTEIL
jgi:mRNA interferase HicA